MEVSIAGAGPAGLYLAILLRKAGHDVVVHERNAPDATFGWGVVFSEETMGALRDADPRTHLEITDSFARWSTIDIRYRGEVLRSTGHSFTAISRRHLLGILQRRAAELGADLRFHSEVDEPPEADLRVAADGANSRVRSARFKAKVVPQGGKYVWFGTDLVLDSFTFAFRPTEFGLFQAHAYPFDEHTSTWIVECAEPVWRRAGLAEMSEEDSIAFCERLFADDLAGHRLRSNRSLWLDFPLVRCPSWHRGNLVLLGDAAHTAHFSIGSGTKLAMEDSIALAAALDRHGTDLAAALTDYELERQPVVDRFQQAAGDSAAYFGRTGHYTGFEPVQFAFNLLTRSGRITHGTLAQRDPALVRSVDAWFAGRGPDAVAPPPLFAPLLGLPNRLAAEVSDVDSAVARAEAGIGLVLGEPVAVTPEGRLTPDTPLFEEAAWRAYAEKVREAGARLGLRLTHAGARGTQGPLVAASPVPYGPFAPVPTELTDLDGVLRAFADTAARAAGTGIDLLELDIADGHLLAGFRSPLTNRRSDEWAKPHAFPLAVFDAVRAAWPGTLSARLTVTDWSPKGATIEDGTAFARLLREHGVDLVHIRAGHTRPDFHPEYRRGYLTTLSDRVRNGAGVRTMVGGYLTTLDEVNTVVAAGRADLCLLADPRPGAKP
ncbi:FAD-dependent monooxygenase [Actinokineospora auranticolor]|uniref:Anthraniloyl-CoA monooxygenase n=1 Tax=Actinokineospora auranticolor TaxID=155976 RepID=A0A2S6GEM2_9PSEU|nr:FAD-dependent monooxygenase [Actinokineospora auranticolor]PPK63601.1 anthraniloyl-CoA monooxygenase [Actinokineospora auranticolor]